MWNRIQGKQHEQKTEDTEKAADKYGYTAKRNELAVYAPIITPDATAPGGKVSQQISYVILSPDKDKEFDVVEVVTLSGSNMVLELSRKTARKAQGRYLSTLEFVIPQDLPPGTYQLISKIKAAGQEKQQTGSFIVKK